MQEEPIVNLSGTPNYSVQGIPMSPLTDNPLYTPLDDPTIIHGQRKDGNTIYASDETMAEAAPYKTGRYPTVMYGYNNENIYAQNQSGMSRIWNSGVNLVNKIGAYTLQNAGFIGGAAFAAVGGIANYMDKWGGGEGKVVEGGNAVSLMSDNFLTQLGDAWKEKVQEVNPIYKTDKYTKGTIWNKLLTTSWWLDDAMDRVALTGAMLLPGVAESQGLFGLAGIVMREGGILEASGAIPKLAKFLADNPKWYGKIGKLLGSDVYKAAATGVVDESTASVLAFKTAVKSAQNLELTTFNVIGQNGLNARETQTSIVKSLREQREKGLSNYTDEEIENMAAEGAKAAFWYNMPLTLLSSMWELPQIFSSMKGGVNLFKKITGTQGLEEFQAGLTRVAGETVKPSIWNVLGRTALTGLEHGQLESSQVAIGRDIEEAIAGKMVDGKVERNQKESFNPWDISTNAAGSFREYIKNFSDPNGQNNIALGTIQGMLMTIFGRVYKGYTHEYVNQDKANKTLLDHINEAITDRRMFNPLSEIVQTDEQGNILTTKGADGKLQTVWDQSKLAQLGTSYVDHIAKFDERLRAIREGDKVKVDEMNFNSLKALAFDFFQDVNGKKYLKNVLEWGAKEQKANTDRENDVENGKEETPDIKLLDNLAYVEDLYKIYNAIDQRHAGFLSLKMDAKDKEGKKEELALAKEFTDGYKAMQYSKGADQVFYNNRLLKNNLELAGVTEKSDDITDTKVERNNKLLDENVILNKNLQEAKDAYKLSIDRNEINNAWKQKKEQAIQFKKNAEAIKNNLTENEQPPIGEEQKVELETQKGKKSYNVGEKYFIGQTVDYDEKGLAQPVAIKEFKILKDNGDGTVDVLTNKNEVKTVNKDAFKKYHIGTTNALATDDNANFFYQHPNDIFTFNFGKDKFGKPREKEGRLEYQDGKLYFVYEAYKDKKGNAVLRRIETNRNQYKAQGEFNQAMIRKTGEIRTKEQQDALNRLTDEKKIAEEKLKLDQSVRQRNELLSDLYKELSINREESKDFIEKKKGELNRITTRLGELKKELEKPENIDKRFTKEITFKKHADPYVNAIRRISLLKERVEKQIEDRENQGTNIEIALSYVQDTQQNIIEMPAGLEDFTKEIEDQIKTLTDAVRDNEEQVSSLRKILTVIEKALSVATKTLNDIIGRYPEIFPNVGYEQNIKALEDIVAETEDFVIKPNEKELSDTKDAIDALEKEIKELEPEIIGKQVILDKFAPYAEKLKKLREEEEQIDNNKKVGKDAEEVMKSTNAGIRNANLNEKSYKTDYEKDRHKDVLYVLTGTAAPEYNKPHQVRANTFGVNLNKFKNRDNIRGVYITSNNEGVLIPGLTDFMRTRDDKTIDEDIEKDNIVALVMVEIDKNDNLTLVGVDGKPLAEGVDPLENGIFHVFPLKELRWDKKYGKDEKGRGKSYFRSNVPEDVQEALRKEYGEWRDGVLKNTEGMTEKTHLLRVTHNMDASFGLPIYVKMGDEENSPIDYNTRTSAEDAKLTTDDEMKSKVVITIPTLNNVEEQKTVRFTNALGRVFFKSDNGLEKFQNRQLNKDEATSVYKTILQLAKNMMNPSIGITSDESKRLLTYLRSIIYWRVPKEGEPKYLGRNNCYFQKDPKTNKFMLYISDDEGKTYEFKPSALEENKELIIKDLQSLFNNINSLMIKYTNEKYEEIQDINSKGEPISRMWENYQTYLLSKRTPNGTLRKGEELPLYTWLKPVEGDEVNRHGVYFYVKDDPESPAVPEYNKKGKAKPDVILKAEKPIVAEEKVAEEELPQTEAEWKKKAAYGIKGAIANDVIKEQNKGEEFVVGEETSIKEFTTPKGRKIKYFVKGTVDNTNFDKMIGLPNAINETLEITQEDVDNIESAIAERVIGLKELYAKNVPEEKKETSEENIDVSDDIKRRIEEAKKNKLSNDDPVFRLVDDELKSVTVEDWGKVAEWLKANYQNIPIYRLQNIIKTTTNRKAWGMIKNNALYIFKNSEVGTIYHEAFEDIWKRVLSPEEINSIYNEFQQRQGTFYDAKSKQNIKYSDATIKQAKERIAEEFRDYVQDNKIPLKPKDGRPLILKLFSDLVHFIKSFFVSPGAESKLEELFSKINKGYYKNAIPETPLSFKEAGIIDIESEPATEGSEYSIVKLSDRERGDIVDHLTYMMLAKLIETDESLLNIAKPKEGKKALYEMLKDKLLDRVAKKVTAIYQRVDDGKITKEQAAQEEERVARLMSNIEEEWDGIVANHEDYIKRHNIEFDENDQLQIRSDENTGKGDHFEATKVDWFKKSSPAIKILIATLPRMEMDENGNAVYKLTSINGYSLIPQNQSRNSIMNKIHNARNLPDMMRKLRQMAKDDPNYRRLYARLMKEEYNTPGDVNFNNVKKTHGMQLLSAFYKTFKKQNPSVMNIFILDNGDVVTGDAALSTAASQLRMDYESAIVMNAKSGKGYFKYNQKTKRFVGDPESVKKVNLIDDVARIAFLNTLGIEFTKKEIKYLKDYNDRVYSEFKKAVNGIKKSIVDAEEIASFSGKALNMKGRLLELGFVKSITSNPQFNSTYFNVVGESIQSYIDVNAFSEFYDFLSDIKAFDEDNLNNTQYEYLLTDVFAQGSNLMERKYAKDGTPIKSEGNPNVGEELLRVGYAGGIINNMNGKSKEPSKLTYMERLIQEFNLNRKGWYLNLVPGDAATPWMIMMGNPISIESVRRGMTDTFEIFGKYFISEMNLARDGRELLSERAKNYKGDLSKELRFFKNILEQWGEKGLYKKIMAEEGDATTIYNTNKEKIDNAVKAYIENKVARTERALTQYGVLSENQMGFTLKNMGFQENMNRKALTNELTALTVNYIIANTELHKLVYSDPYQYDNELKRTKSSLSPRQAILSESNEIGSANFNNTLNKVWNEGYEKVDLGYDDFTKDGFRTVTLSDVKATSLLPGYTEFKESDGAALMTLKGSRQYRIRNGEWFDDNEEQYRYDVAWEKRDRISKGNNKITLSKKEQDILTQGNPRVQSTYTPIKPITTGNKANGKAFNDRLLDKDAVFIYSYRVLSDINENGGRDNSDALSLYNKMMDENIDYGVFKSGRKVGAEQTHDVYKKGLFNTAKFKGIINVPFSIIGTQTDVPAKMGDVATTGSQMTKLVTMDFMDAGVPLDFMPDEEDFSNRYEKWFALPKEEKLKSPIYKEIMNNQELIEAQIDEGYNSLINKLGIKETTENGEKRYDFGDFSKAVAAIKDEILKREVNNNIMLALNAFQERGISLETTPAYQQVRHILYSMVDKLIVSRKMPGGYKVQMPITFLADNGIEMTEGANGKKVYVSKALKNYEDKDGERYCEIMVSRWFDSDKTDKQLINEWYKKDKDGNLKVTEEGKKILGGVGFRIPTEKQNFIDVFVVKQFLPREYADSVVFPSALVQKDSSDFDIDKRSLYLKNLYKNAKGELKTVPFLGYGEEAKAKFKELYKAGEFLTNKQRQLLNRFIAEEKDEFFSNVHDEETGELIDTPENKLIRDIFSEAFTDEALTREFVDEIRKEGIENKIANSMYKKSLENAYIESCEVLISHPSNFDKLITPNSTKQLQKYAKDIAIRTTGKEFDYDDIDNMLDRTFMSRLRHAFVSTSRSRGIAVVNQNNHAQNQRQLITTDKNLLVNVPLDDLFWLDDCSIKFSKYNRIKQGEEMLPTLSKSRNAEGQLISDVNAQIIDGVVDALNGPWIVELGVTPEVIATYSFLAKNGVPVGNLVYFMKQPIIMDFLRSLESKGYTWLFNRDIVEETTLNYVTPEDLTKAMEERKVFTIPGEKELRELVRDIEKEPLTKQENINQVIMFYEFLKYAKMAQHLFTVTQATNHDTAPINDPLLILKKEMQMVEAQKTIINSPLALLRGSFVGKLSDVIGTPVRDALATILTSDQKKMRGVLRNILAPYTHLTDREFLKVGQKAVADVFDWAVQTDQGFNNLIKATLMKGGAVDQIANYAKDVRKNINHPLHDNLILRDPKEGGILSIIPSPRGTPKSVTNIKIRGNENRVYDQNNIIGAFREIRDEVGENSPIYKGLINVAILQSGLSPSQISYTSLIPFEDLMKIYNETIIKLESLPLDTFYTLGVFQRTNYYNEDIVTNNAAFWYKPKFSRKIYNLGMAFFGDPWVKKAVRIGEENAARRERGEKEKEGGIPHLMTIPEENRDAREKYIFYTWNQMDSLLTEEDWTKVNKESGWYKQENKKLELIFKHQTEMRNRGDSSYRKKALFEKVVHERTGETLYREYKDRRYIVYKAINPWGDGTRANEFYDVEKPSIIDNGLEKVQTIRNSELFSLFLQENKEEMKTEEPTINQEKFIKGEDEYYKAPVEKKEYVGKPEFNKLPFKSIVPTMTYAGIGSRTQTPKEMLPQITEVAKELEAKGYTLNTGKTFNNKEEGVDEAFSKGATKKNLFSPEKQGSRAREQAIAKEIHPAPQYLQGGGLKLQARNTNQVFGDNLNTPVDFVLFYAKEGKGIRPEGGTGQAVEMARRKNIPTINMADKNWRAQLDNILSKGATEKISSMKLNDGKIYKVEDINSKMLEKMGYSPIEIGKLLKDIC